MRRPQNLKENSPPWIEILLKNRGWFFRFVVTIWEYLNFKTFRDVNFSWILVFGTMNTLKITREIKSLQLLKYDVRLVFAPLCTLIESRIWHVMLCLGTIFAYFNEGRYFFPVSFWRLSDATRTKFLIFLKPHLHLWNENEYFQKLELE